jgi:Ni/Fe-hydrogenase subunit HybB-like protein
MSQQDDRDTNGGDRQQVWPLYVRVLAVCCVLSYALQPVAFIGLTGTAVVLYGLGRPVDGLLVGLGAGGIVVVVLCGVFRRWFTAWGRRNYPEQKPE